MKNISQYLVYVLLALSLCLSACVSTTIKTLEKIIPTTLISTPVPVHTATLSLRQQSIQEMLLVVDIVEKYHNDYGFYPESINDLIPVYLAELPFTNEGFEITYSLHEKYIYEVSFWPATNRYCSFVKRDDHWECGFYVEH